MYFDVRIEERREEAEPLDVVHVKMGQEQVDTADRGRERATERTDAGARVQDDHGAVVTAHLDAGRVAAVARRVRSGRRERSAHAPQRDLHGRAASQKIATAPT